MAYRYGLAMALAALLALPGPAPAQDPRAGPEPRPEDFAPSAEPQAAHDLFAMPAITAGVQRMAAQVEAGDLDGAVATVEALVAAHPTVGLLPANRAALHMLAGETEAAVACLERAAALGLDDLPRLLDNPLFAPIAADPRLADLEARTPGTPVAPSPLVGRTARVDGGNTAGTPPAAGWRLGSTPPRRPRRPGARPAGRRRRLRPAARPLPPRPRRGQRTATSTTTGTEATRRCPRATTCR